MRKIIFSFIIAFTISLPYASAERLLDIGAEVFYQRFMEYNNILEYTELVSSNDMYFFNLRHGKETVSVTLKSNPEGYVDYILIEGSTINEVEAMAIAIALTEKVSGMTSAEIDHLGNEANCIRDDDSVVSKVWVSSLNRPVERFMMRNIDGTVSVMFSQPIPKVIGYGG